MKHFCCVCGKEGKFDNYACPGCKVTEMEEEEPKSRPVCKYCGRTKVENRWRSILGSGAPNSICPECIAAQGGYYETIIQFRAKDFPKERLEQIFDQVMRGERERGIHVEITKVDGKHYYFTKAKTAKKIARRIAAEWRIRPKETRKLVGFTHDKGKGKYRFTIFFDLDLSKIEK